MLVAALYGDGTLLDIHISDRDDSVWVHIAIAIAHDVSIRLLLAARMERGAGEFARIRSG